MAGVDVLLNNISANAGIDTAGEWITWLGGPGDFWVWGNLGGGKVHLEAALHTTAPVEVCNTSITGTTNTSSGVTKFNFNHGTRIRAVLSDAPSAASGVYAKVN